MQNIMDTLIQFYNDHNLGRSFQKRFEYCLESYSKSQSEEYQIYFSQDKLIELRTNKLAYELLFPNLSEPKISIVADIYVDSKAIGWYKEVYESTGELFDYFFNIE